VQDILQLHGILKQHVIIYSPPYSILNILEPLLAPHGRQVHIVINHGNRDVQIVEKSIVHHVLQTTIRAFQTHRLSAEPPARLLDQRFVQMSSVFRHG
tara:strand:- start:321 stop:614 length:294 start_codon:yes stop_codon:yes gene_type:complete